MPATLITDKTEALIQAAEADLKQAVWPGIEATLHATFARVLEGFITTKVDESHFYSVTGYGHDDLGRDALDRVFAHALEADAALVRPQFVSGTHTLSVALNGCLGHGDRLVILTGTPYDTLHPVLGLAKSQSPSPQSLVGRGVSIEILNLITPEGQIRTELTPEEQQIVSNATVLYLQRSRGYDPDRPTLTLSDLKAAIKTARAHAPREAIVMVDNCYGEFAESHEPTHPEGGAADLIVGSLIKNPGGGIAPTGGYIAGKPMLVARCAEALTCPGIGADGGYTFNLTRTLLQGLYLAPGIVAEAKKNMTLIARLLTAMPGVITAPHWDAPVRGDIIQTLTLGAPERLKRFCRLVQSVSPVSGYLSPEPAVVPGYEDAVVMAGGTFIDGSSIELSADGPMRPPYMAFLQGGLTYAHGRYLARHLLHQFSEILAL